MIIAFFESFRYMGHLWPIALLRIYAGVLFFNAGMSKLSKGFLEQPLLQQTINHWIESGSADHGYVGFLQNWVLPHWQVFSYMVVFGEIAVGLSFILGFMVRPAALGALLMNINFLFAAGESAAPINKLFIAVNSALFLLSAGRCFGVDYYFYKRVRGFWW